MPLPRDQDARNFYQSGKQRFEDARLLLAAKRTTGAVYLAGYSVECMLKTLILSTVPAVERAPMVRTFRGARSHDYDWLKKRYFASGGRPFPPGVSKDFSMVSTWTTALRYKPGTTDPRVAQKFLDAAEAIILWVDGSL